MSEIDGIAQQHLERSETEQLVDDVRDQRLALEEAERHRGALALDHPDDEIADFRLGVLAPHPRQPLEVEPVQQILVNAALQLLVVRAARVHAAAPSVNAVESVDI